jgi:hypothetical protein
LKDFGLPDPVFEGFLDLSHLVTEGHLRQTAGFISITVRDLALG